MGKRAKGSTNQYNYVVNRARSQKLPYPEFNSETRIGDFTSSQVRTWQQIPKHYPSEFIESDLDRSDSGSALASTAMLMGGIVLIFAIAGIVVTGLANPAPVSSETNIL